VYRSGQWMEGSGDKWTGGLRSARHLEGLLILIRNSFDQAVTV
jgi:hypothetical protein